MSDAPAIYTALAAVMADVQAVAKRDKNEHQRFMFRGIDAVMNAVGPALRAHQVIVTPDVRSITYADVTTSTGKPATACRVEVAYTFHATDGSSIPTLVAGEAWDSGDKACPKAMSVAFRTALLQALCLPTDEPDPDSHSYERSTVDMSQVNAAIAEAQSLKIEGDYDGTREWAAQSQQNADAAASRLRKAIAEKRVKQADEESGTEDQAPTDEAGEDDTQADPAASSSTSGDTDTPGTPEGADEAPAGDDAERPSSPAPNPCKTCGPEPRTQPCPDCPDENDPARLAERAREKADGNAEREAQRERINAAFRRLATDNHEQYRALWDRLRGIVGGHPNETSWDGCSISRLNALAEDAERLVGELEPA